MRIKRSRYNPIVVPGGADFRKVVTFNPGVILHNNRFYMYERAAGSLRPFQTRIGLLTSDDGIHFQPASEQPVFTGEHLGIPTASVEDARVSIFDGKFYMVYAMQPYQFDCWPNGTGVPRYYPENYKEWADTNTEPMITQSGIAVSDDGVHFKQLGYTTPKEIDDRDNAFFPEKINGKYALLRRPMQYVGEKYGTELPGIWISYSDDMRNWEAPKLVAVAENQKWEGTKIGAAATPLKSDQGWLVLYHGVDTKSIYRVGALMLDLNDPTKVVARTKKFIMEPKEYYERFGLVIPNVVFPTANVVKDGLVYIYYGCCDTCISLATVPLHELVAHVMKGKRA
jgi:beta-1,2-mannobiose phosphorylase / 1,2-beta-oligomannan phosphorylase